MEEVEEVEEDRSCSLVVVEVEEEEEPDLMIEPLGLSYSLSSWIQKEMSLNTRCYVECCYSLVACLKTKAEVLGSMWVG